MADFTRGLDQLPTSGRGGVGGDSGSATHPGGPHTESRGPSGGGGAGDRKTPTAQEWYGNDFNYGTPTWGVTAVHSPIMPDPPAMSNVWERRPTSGLLTFSTIRQGEEGIFTRGSAFDFGRMEFIHKELITSSVPPQYQGNNHLMVAISIEILGPSENNAHLSKFWRDHGYAHTSLKFSPYDDLAQQQIADDPEHGYVNFYSDFKKKFRVFHYDEIKDKEVLACGGMLYYEANDGSWKKVFQERGSYLIIPCRVTWFFMRGTDPLSVGDGQGIYYVPDHYFHEIPFLYEENYWVPPHEPRVGFCEWSVKYKASNTPGNDNAIHGHWERTYRSLDNSVLTGPVSHRKVPAGDPFITERPDYNPQPPPPPPDGINPGGGTGDAPPPPDTGPGGGAGPGGGGVPGGIPGGGDNTGGDNTYVPGDGDGNGGGNGGGTSDPGPGTGTGGPGTGVPGGIPGGDGTVPPSGDGNGGAPPGGEPTDPGYQKLFKWSTRVIDEANVHFSWVTRGNVEQLKLTIGQKTNLTGYAYVIIFMVNWNDQNTHIEVEGGYRILVRDNRGSSIFQDLTVLVLRLNPLSAAHELYFNREAFTVGVSNIYWGVLQGPVENPFLEPGSPLPNLENALWSGEGFTNYTSADVEYRMLWDTGFEQAGALSKVQTHIPDPYSAAENKVVVEIDDQDITKHHNLTMRSDRTLTGRVLVTVPARNRTSGSHPSQFRVHLTFMSQGGHNAGALFNVAGGDRQAGGLWVIPLQGDFNRSDDISREIGITFNQASAHLDARFPYTYRVRVDVQGPAGPQSRGFIVIYQQSAHITVLPDDPNQQEDFGGDFNRLEGDATGPDGYDPTGHILSGFRTGSFLLGLSASDTSHAPKDFFREHTFSSMYSDTLRLDTTMLETVMVAHVLPSTDGSHDPYKECYLSFDNRLSRAITWQLEMPSGEIANGENEHARLISGDLTSQTVGRVRLRVATGASLKTRKLRIKIKAADWLAVDTRLNNDLTPSKLELNLFAQAEDDADPTNHLQFRLTQPVTGTVTPVHTDDPRGEADVNTGTGVNSIIFARSLRPGQFSLFKGFRRGFAVEDLQTFRNTRNGRLQLSIYNRYAVLYHFSHLLGGSHGYLKLVQDVMKSNQFFTTNQQLSLTEANLSLEGLIDLIPEKIRQSVRYGLYWVANLVTGSSEIFSSASTVWFPENLPETRQYPAFVASLLWNGFSPDDTRAISTLLRLPLDAFFAGVKSATLGTLGTGLGDQFATPSTGDMLGGLVQNAVGTAFAGLIGGMAPVDVIKNALSGLFSASLWLMGANNIKIRNHDIQYLFEQLTVQRDSEEASLRALDGLLTDFNDYYERALERTRHTSLGRNLVIPRGFITTPEREQQLGLGGSDSGYPAPPNGPPQGNFPNPIGGVYPSTGAQPQAPTNAISMSTGQPVGSGFFRPHPLLDPNNVDTKYQGLHEDEMDLNTRTTRGLRKFLQGQGVQQSRRENVAIEQGGVPAVTQESIIDRTGLMPTGHILVDRPSHFGVPNPLSEGLDDLEKIKNQLYRKREADMDRRIIAYRSELQKRRLAAYHEQEEQIKKKQKGRFQNRMLLRKFKTPGLRASFTDIERPYFADNKEKERMYKAWF